MIEEVRQKHRRKETAQEEERRVLVEGMAKTCAELNQAYARFDLYSDPDLIDSCVYEINALRSRYAYYIRKIKRLNEGGEVEE